MIRISCRLRYPRDLTDEEWALAEPLIPSAKRGGNRRHVVVREVGREGRERFYILRNGSLQQRSLPQVSEPKQHRQRPLQLAIQMDLIAAQSLQLVRVERFPNACSLIRGRLAISLLRSSNQGSTLISMKRRKAIDIGGGRFFVLLAFTGFKLEGVGPPLLRIFL